MRKPLMAIAIAACLVMSVVGGLLPILQGWIFFVIALYLLATEFADRPPVGERGPPPLALAQPLDRAGPRPSLGTEPSQGIRGPDGPHQIAAIIGYRLRLDPANEPRSGSSRRRTRA